MVKFLLWIVLSHFQFQCQFWVYGNSHFFFAENISLPNTTHTGKKSAISDWNWLEMHIIQLVKGKRWMKKGQAKCSFVLEWQHTNLHLFNDLFVSFEFSVSSHVNTCTQTHTHTLSPFFYLFPSSSHLRCLVSFIYTVPLLRAFSYRLFYSQLSLINDI